MTAIGGSLETLAINGREFPVAADAEAKRKLGGWENEVEINGDGSARIIKTRVPLSLEGIVLEVDDDKGDHEFLQDIVDGKAFVPIVLTYGSGGSWQGTAIITGDNSHNSKSTTIEVNLKGPGTLTKH